VIEGRKAKSLCQGLGPDGGRRSRGGEAPPSGQATKLPGIFAEQKYPEKCRPVRGHPRTRERPAEASGDFCGAKISREVSPGARASAHAKNKQPPAMKDSPEGILPRSMKRATHGDEAWSVAGVTLGGASFRAAPPATRPRLCSASSRGAPPRIIAGGLPWLRLCRIYSSMRLPFTPFPHREGGFEPPYCPARDARAGRG